MSSHSRNQLVGKPFIASIGDPWDFASEAGQNTITGSIIAVSDTVSNVDWLLFKIRPFQYLGVNIRQVVGVNRYKSSQNLFGELLAGNITTLNFMFTLDGHELRSDTLISELDKGNTFGFLVGSVTKVG